jgi:hypothetical protein
MSFIKIEIGDSKREFENTYDIDESWINQQIIRRKKDRISICVKVYIKNETVDVLLKTPACRSGGGSGREPKPQERKIIDLWNERGLNKENFAGGNLISFFKQLRKIIG